MALIRILVDGYSLLHQWPQLAAGKARYSQAARDELAQVLTRYQDVSGVPITIVFDGAAQRHHASTLVAPGKLEILYSRSGQTADQMIERAAHLLQCYGDVLVVTEDHAERDTVQAAGALTSNCLNFIAIVENALSDLDRNLKRHNQQERQQFRRPRIK